MATKAKAWTHGDTEMPYFPAEFEIVRKAVLQVTDVTLFPHRLCRPAKARGLRVIPPNRVAPGFARLRFLACSRAGTTYLRIQRVQPGRGHL